MLYWIILISIILIISVIATIGQLREWLYFEYLWTVTAFVGYATVFILIGLVILTSFTSAQGLYNFKQQEVYIQTHIAKNDIENAALTSKKIELNDWLFNEQWTYKRIGSWSIQSKEILELKPID